MPARFVGREAYVDELAESLCANGSAALPLHGMAGVGKTTLASALAHHKDVLERFTDGVLWGRIGPDSELKTLLEQWARELGTDITDIDDLGTRVRIVCAGINKRRLLVVLDDVWSSETARLLRCGSPQSGYILTTRDASIAQLFEPDTPPVPILDPEYAHQLVRELVPEAWRTDEASVRALVKSVGGLPLALELLGSYLERVDNQSSKVTIEATWRKAK